MPRIMIEGYLCSRCGHRWAPRALGSLPPKQCPACRSPQWDLSGDNEADHKRASEAARRLAAMGGSAPDLEYIPRRGRTVDKRPTSRSRVVRFTR